MGVVMAVDVGTGLPVALAVLDEHDMAALRAWLAEVREQYGVEVVVTDELATYGLAAGTLKVTHGHCEFYRSRRVGRALRRFAQEPGAEFQPLVKTVAVVLSCGRVRRMGAGGSWSWRGVFWPASIPALESRESPIASSSSCWGLLSAGHGIGWPWVIPGCRRRTTAPSRRSSG